jgi:hypothetical protein
VVGFDRAFPRCDVSQGAGVVTERLEGAIDRVIPVVVLLASLVLILMLSMFLVVLVAMLADLVRTVA